MLRRYYRGYTYRGYTYYDYTYHGYTYHGYTYHGYTYRGVQASMLKLMEDAEVPIAAAAGGGRGAPLGAPAAPGWGYTRGAQGQGQQGQQGRQRAPTLLRTRHVLWIFSGAFAALERDLFEQDLHRRAAAKAVAKAGGEAAASPAAAAAASSCLPRLGMSEGGIHA